MSKIWFCAVGSGPSGFKKPLILYPGAHAGGLGWWGLWDSTKAHEISWTFVESHKPWLAGWLAGQWGSSGAPLLHHCCRLAGWLAGWPPPHSGFPNNLWFLGIFLLKVFLKPTSEDFESKILKNAPFVAILGGFWKNTFLKTFWTWPDRGGKSGS